jgi:transposase
MRLTTKEAQGFRLHQIIALEEAGENRKKIALITQCSPSWVSKVIKRCYIEGVENVRPKGCSPGHKPALGQQQLTELKEILRGNTKDYGFDTEGWTRLRIAQVIEQRYGVRHDLSNISRIVQKINFTLQKPLPHDYRQNPQKVKEWEEEKLPALKKKAEEESYKWMNADEASVSLTSYTGRVYAPKGERPVVEINTEITSRLYLASAVSPQGELVYSIEDKPFDSKAIVEFLKALLACFPDEKIMVIWDNASIHDSAFTRTFLSEDAQAKRLYLSKQPTYSPRFNADEQVWSQLKCHGLVRVCCHSLNELKKKVKEEMDKIKNNPELIKQFFHHPDLCYY